MWGLRRATNAPRAIFKSHFTLLRVKRPDTALCEGKRREAKSERERMGMRMRVQCSEWRKVNEMMLETALEVEEESEGHDMGEVENNGCWH